MKEVINDSFSARLANHPTLKARFESILDVAENTNGDLISADEAEQRAIEEVRQLGNEHGFLIKMKGQNVSKCDKL